MKLNRKTIEDNLLSLTLFSVILWGIIFFLFGLSIFFNFITEFFAGLFGVLIAFLIQYNQKKRDEQIQRENLCRDLRDELQEIKRNMEKETLFFPDIWDSAIASGQLRLLNSDQTRVLTNVYRDVRRIEHDSLRITEIEEELRLATAKGQQSIMDDLNFKKSPIVAIKKQTTTW